MKKIRLNYIVIPAIVIAVALIGSWFSTQGMPWYNSTLIKPSINPPRWVFPIAWNTIFLLTTISALIIWNQGKAYKPFLWIFHRRKEHPNHWKATLLLIANAILNVGWSFLFFTQQMIGAALIEMIVLELTIIGIIVLTWPISRWASLLLLPYALWVAFATYLTYLIWTLN